MQSIIETLEFIKNNPMCDSSALDINIVTDLYNKKLIEGIEAGSIGDDCFLELRINIDGEQYLKSLKNSDSENNHTSNKTISVNNQWSNNPARIIALIVIGGFILSALIYLFKKHTGIPLN